MNIYYEPYLKKYSRSLRSNMTDAELQVWRYLRRKQFHNIQFYRQRPIDRYIVDFISFNPKIIIEIDGSQHFILGTNLKDKERDNHLQSLGFKVVRYNDYEVLTNIEGFIEHLEALINT